MAQFPFEMYENNEIIIITKHALIYNLPALVSCLLSLEIPFWIHYVEK